MTVPIGASALLRVAGLPIRYWLAGANPTLFDLVRQLTAAEDRYGELGAIVAKQIGLDIVPCPALSPQDRAFALWVRRKLHRGDRLDAVEMVQLASLGAGVLTAQHRLANDLETLGRCCIEIAAVERQVHEGLAREEARLLRLPSEVLDDSPLWHAARTYVDDRWPIHSAKQARQHAQRMWRIVTRAATASTPRHWFSHVALVVADDDGDLATLAVTDEFAAHWMQSIEAQRRALVDGRTPVDKSEIRLAMTPLHRSDNGHVRFTIVDAEEPQAAELSLRRTALLETVCSLLLAAPMTVDQLDEAIQQGESPEDAAVLRGFVRYLVELGILQPCATPSSRLTSWASAAGALVPRGEPDSLRDGWVDVYRRATSCVPAAHNQRLQRLVVKAMQVLALISADASSSRAKASGDATPRRLMDLLAERLNMGGVTLPAWRRPPDWDMPVSAESGFGRLHAYLASQLDKGSVVDLDPMLTEIGSRPEVIEWPVDCLLRMPSPDAPYAAVLDQVWPAGTVDARFVEALHHLHGPVPHVEAYRRFIERLESETGILMVELLIPPLSTRAANAVRRPAYTRAFTGDADLATYQPVDSQAARYIPLDAITIRQTTGGPVAEVDGQRIWTVYHATRSPLPPWDHLAELLLATAPRMLPWTSRRLRYSLNLFHERAWMPRITIGELVVSAAQWRLPVDQLWDPALPTAAKVIAVTRLRDRYELPRWIFAAAPDAKPRPCDLESLPGIRQLERLGQEVSPILIAMEMLPDPDALLVGDRAHRSNDRLVAELLLRLPCDETPEAMASRLARRLGQSVFLQRPISLAVAAAL
jgi:hypothetical protein